MTCQSNGVWGTLSVGLFASANRLKIAFGETNDIGVFNGGNGTLLGCQVVGILFVIGWVTVIMIPFFYFLNYLGWLRAAPVDEVEGLDSRYHKKRRPSAEFAHAMSVYGQGNQRLRRNINSTNEGQMQATNFTEESGGLSGENNDRYRRSSITADSFEDHTPKSSQRKQYEQRFTATSAGCLDGAS